MNKRAIPAKVGTCPALIVIKGRKRTLTVGDKIEFVDVNNWSISPQWIQGIVDKTDPIPFISMI